LGHGGWGVARIDGQVCFVAYGLPGDLVRLSIRRKSKGVLWADIEEVLESSPDRVAASCPCFGRCGGCPWLHFAYPAQAEWKRRIVADTLARIGGINTDVRWIEDSALRTAYRTRAEFHAHHGKVGFFAAQSQTVVDVEQCPLCHPHLNEALLKLRRLPLDGSIEVVANPEGPHVFIWTSRRNPALEGLFPVAEHPRRDREPSAFLFDGIPVVNGAFSQSSLLLNRLLRQTVRGLVGGAQHVLDLYCGSGNLSLDLPTDCEVLGFDHDRHGIAAANELRPDSYRTADETAFTSVLDRPWDVILIDPPRTGAKALAPSLGKSRADRIVYVSCDPATLARDLKTIVAQGWAVADTVAIDLFPNTAHVETVCELRRI